MTLGEFAYLLDVEPKWVQNAFANLKMAPTYTIEEGQRLGLARVLHNMFGVPLGQAHGFARQALNAFDGSHAPVTISNDTPVSLTIDVYRFLSSFNVRRSLLQTHYQPKRRGRSYRGPVDPVQVAREYGLDLTLITSNRARSVAERIRQLDDMRDFVRAVQKTTTPPGEPT